MAAYDLTTVQRWLAGRGFKMNSVYPSGMMIDFSGTAGLVKAAFHTEIHRLDVNGAAHIANASDQSIPAALRPVVAGVISLTDFRAHPTSCQPAEHDRNLILTRVTAGLDRLMQRSIAVSDRFEIHCLHH